MEQAVTDKQDAQTRSEKTTTSVLSGTDILSNALSGTAILGNVVLHNLLSVSPVISSIPENLANISSLAAIASLALLSSKEEWNNTSRTTAYVSIFLSTASAFTLVGDLSGQIHRSIPVPQEVSARYAKNPEFKSQIDRFIADTFKQCSNGSSKIQGPLYECPLIEDAPQP